MTEVELRVKPICNGTVIDHIAAGQALNVLKILGITSKAGATVSVVMNVGSDKLGKKDIVKVENRELKEEEVGRIALIAPDASINIIRDYKVIEKHQVDLPDQIVGVVRVPESKLHLQYLRAYRAQAAGQGQESGDTALHLLRAASFGEHC